MRTVRAAIRFSALAYLVVCGGVIQAQQPVEVEETLDQDQVQGRVVEYTPSANVSYVAEPVSSGNVVHGLGLVRDANAALGETVNRALVAKYRAILTIKDSESGVALEPVDESLRAQLDIPAGQGLIVTSVAPDGPAAQAGLTTNDLLLTLGGKPLAQPKDLTVQLKAAGEKPQPLKIIRSGKPLTIDVKPIYRVTIGKVVTRNDGEFYLGVPVSAPDEALRAHLDLPTGEGLVITQIQRESPASKAGLKPFDILLSVADKPLTDAKILVEQIQASQGKPIPVKILRGGKHVTIVVTPERRKTTGDSSADPHPKSAFLVRAADPFVVQQPQHQTRSVWVQKTPSTASSEKRIDDLIREVKELRQALERLQSTIKEKGN